MIVWRKIYRGGKKRSLSLWGIANNESTVKRRRQQKNALLIYLSDVPPQPPIPKSSGRVKECASKYTGKQQTIGCYDDEEDAAGTCSIQVQRGEVPLI